MSQHLPLSRAILLMTIAFLGIFVYGLLAALPGSVLPTLERNQFLPNDSAVATFLLINAIGAVVAYLVSGPIIDRIGKKVALVFGTVLVIASMIGFASTVSKVSPPSALFYIFTCSLLLGLGANAIVAAGHALVADVAAGWRNARSTMSLGSVDTGPSRHNHRIISGTIAPPNFCPCKFMPHV